MEEVKKTVQKFAQVLFEGRISDAERMLERLAKRVNDQSAKRLHHALHGLYYAYVNDDKDSLLFKLYKDGKPSENVKKYREALESTLSSPLGENDVFIETWLTLIDSLDKLPVPHKLRVKEEESA